MKLRELTEKWNARRAEFARLGVLLDGAKLAEDVLADLRSLEAASTDEVLTLGDAARESGYSTDHLRHLIASEQIANAGRKHAPRIRRADLPRKPGTKAESAYNADADAIRLVGRLSA